MNKTHAIIAGSLFDFMGWLTTRKERIVLSSADEASPAVEAITEFAKMRGLLLDNAQVETWQESLTRSEQEPVAWHYPNGKADQCTTDKEFAEMNPPWTPMYYKQEWVGLTDEERLHIALEVPIEAVVITEATLKQKNK